MSLVIREERGRRPRRISGRDIARDCDWREVDGAVDFAAHDFEGDRGVGVRFRRAAHGCRVLKDVNRELENLRNRSVCRSRRDRGLLRLGFDVFRVAVTASARSRT